jgi:hypothetical protein
MDIFIGSIADSLRKGKNPMPDHPPKHAATDRRRSKQDRRRSVREGIIVTLSIMNDRRSGRDRRSGK